MIDKILKAFIRVTTYLLILSFSFTMALLLAARIQRYFDSPPLPPGTISLADKQGPVVYSKETPAVETVKNLGPYPQAKEGFWRKVIQLPDIPFDRISRQVELTVGQEMMADDCNSVGMRSKVQEGVVNGWGYPYYFFPTKSPGMSTTLVACPGKQSLRFITAAPIMFRYNPNLPIVVYLPEGFDARYRIWKAPDSFE